MSNETGSSEVYVRSTEGPGKWQISDGGGWQPMWSGDGRRFFTAAARDECNRDRGGRR